MDKNKVVKLKEDTQLEMDKFKNNEDSVAYADQLSQLNDVKEKSLDLQKMKAEEVKIEQ